MDRLEEIAAMEICEESIVLLLDRIFDLTEIEGAIYALDENEELSFYERLIVNHAIVKPTLDRLEQELVEYKNELIDIEEARLAEIARVEDLKNRLDAIKDIYHAVEEAGLDIPNPAIEVQRIIKENDEARLVELEIAGAIFDARESTRLTLAARKAAGKKAREICVEVLDLIAGFNLERSLTAEQITSMEDMFLEINAFLGSCRPWSAKPLIEAIVPDGTLVTEEMKEAILEELAQL